LQRKRQLHLLHAHVIHFGLNCKVIIHESLLYTLGNFWIWEAEGYKSNFIILEIHVIFLRIWSSFRFRWLLSPNIVTVYLDQELDSIQSRGGLRKIMYYLKYDKTGLTPFCILGPAQGDYMSYRPGRGGGAIFVGYLVKLIRVIYDPSCRLVLQTSN